MIKTDRLELTEDEAFALLSLCLTSGMPMDPESERAVRKLVEFCRSHPDAAYRRPAPVGPELLGAG